jgi:hypothetical protein
LLQAAPNDAYITMRDRFPAARFIECDQHSSQVFPNRLLLCASMSFFTLHQARFLTARVNPSVTQSSSGSVSHPCIRLQRTSLMHLTSFSATVPATKLCRQMTYPFKSASFCLLYPCCSPTHTPFPHYDIQTFMEHLQKLAVQS